jgi:SAM-dependent methyltransferase
MSEALNQCASSFGGVYDFYMERPWLSKLIGRVMWGIDLRTMYENIDEIGELGGGAMIADVPCGGGLALRGLESAQELRFAGVDIDPKMLETIEADMRELPFEDASVDRLYSFSGLHMINDPERAVAEFARVLKPGGSLIGSSFVMEGTRRKRALWRMEERRGIARPPDDAAAVRAMLLAAGFDEVVVAGSGFVSFSALRG